MVNYLIIVINCATQTFSELLPIKRNNTLNCYHLIYRLFLLMCVLMTSNLIQSTNSQKQTTIQLEPIYAFADFKPSFKLLTDVDNIINCSFSGQSYLSNCQIEINSVSPMSDLPKIDIIVINLFVTMNNEVYTANPINIKIKAKPIVQDVKPTAFYPFMMKHTLHLTGLNFNSFYQPKLSLNQSDYFECSVKTDTYMECERPYFYINTPQNVTIKLSSHSIDLPPNNISVVLHLLPDFFWNVDNVYVAITTSEPLIEALDPISVEFTEKPYTRNNLVESCNTSFNLQLTLFSCDKLTPPPTFQELRCYVKLGIAGFLVQTIGVRLPTSTISDEKSTEQYSRSATGLSSYILIILICFSLFSAFYVYHKQMTKTPKPAKSSSTLKISTIVSNGKLNPKTINPVVVAKLN